MPLEEDSGKRISGAIRERLTTSRELAALNATLDEFKLSDKIDLRRDDKEIEFF